MTASMTSLADPEGGIMGGGGGGGRRIIYISIVKGEAKGSFLKHILQYSLIILCKKAYKEFYKTVVGLVYKYN